MNEELNFFVADLKIVPRCSIVTANKETISQFKRQFSPKEINILSYDTTYNMGNFSVSPLLARNSHFDGEPAFIIGSLIHALRDTESHELFFRRLVSLLPKINSPATVIVTDREKGIRNAIKNVIPDCHNL
jgi:hypothetical protein